MSMSPEQKLMKMFIAVYGDIDNDNSGRRTEILYNDQHDVEGVAIVKEGYESWRISRCELLFDYITLDWREE